MKVRLLPSSFKSDGSASAAQHYCCLVVNGCVAFDAGSLASGVTNEERSNIRDVVLTHSHLDHIAGLPIFIDDLFPILTEPVRVHATQEVIESLEEHIFNWKIYPRFSELENDFGNVIQYHEILPAVEFDLRDLTICAIPVNHKVQSNGFLIRSGKACVAMTGDTAQMDEFWQKINEAGRLKALLIECAFPNEFEELSSISHHLTPNKLSYELQKLTIETDAIYVVNIKPAYRNAIVSQLAAINDERLKIFEVGREYTF
jgi:cAMP phosphodiesterase